MEVGSQIKEEGRPKLENEKAPKGRKNKAKGSSLGGITCVVCGASNNFSMEWQRYMHRNIEK
ncbi:MAG: hypothetical protein WCX31_00280 [Salinivirgaceae bacterium]|jgi:hypothetical protein